ncbi:hypothetical protein [Photobacterium atrarenae]|uniref:Transcriptional regulator n=1 Tax=Photobacterium atrarenae TaxID=865757 RepID=A0ABY5GDS5_9GAMM|nr:hypothetical protein [Photobacterium atrarenae]UTV27395.1 hypothetical protein NNL38_13880 [Photobacterium atrarenae]
MKSIDGVKHKPDHTCGTRSRREAKQQRRQAEYKNVLHRAGRLGVHTLNLEAATAQGQ